MPNQTEKTNKAIELKNSFIKDIKFKKQVTSAMEAFKVRRPWKGSRFERFVKLEQLHRELITAYDMTYVPIRITLKGMCHGWHFGDGMGLGCDDVIHASNKPAVWSYLNAFSAIIWDEGSPVSRVRWSLNLYRVTFPKMFESMIPTGKMLEVLHRADQALA